MGLGMSAFKGEADGNQRPSELPLIAISGHVRYQLGRLSFLTAEDSHLPGLEAEHHGLAHVEGWPIDLVNVVHHQRVFSNADRVTDLAAEELSVLDFAGKFHSAFAPNTALGGDA